MLKKFLSLMLVSILSCSLGVSTFARSLSNPEENAKAAATSTEAGATAATELKSNEKLSADMRQLVADARAGKLAPAAKPQLEPAKSNNFSTKAKIAIGVGVAVVVVALLINHQRKHFFD